MGFGGSGGGSGSIQSSSDVALSGLGNNDVLTYNSSDSKWENKPAQGAGTTPGDVALDSFGGATDDDKLTAAMAYASAQTYPPNIRLTNRAYNFSIQRSSVYAGFRLVGPNVGITNAELGNANATCRVTLSTNGAWLNVVGGDTWDAVIKGITFLGTSSTTFIGAGDGSSIFHASHIRDCTFHGFYTVLGTQTQKLAMTTCLIDGYFQIAGTYNGGIHIGGSDNRLWQDGGLIDASTSYNNSGNAAGQYHFWFDGLDNSDIGPLYITAEAGWGGIRVTGSAYNAGGPPSNLGMVTMRGIVDEGRSAGAPCYGSLLRVEGGIVKVYGAYIARAMSNPSAMGHSPQDAGAVHVTGGMLYLDGVTYDRYTGQPESSPFVYVNGGNARVMNTFIASKGGVWTGKPQVTNQGAGSLIFDDTVTQV